MSQTTSPRRYMTVHQLHAILGEMIEDGEGQSAVLLASDPRVERFPRRKVCRA